MSHNNHTAEMEIALAIKKIQVLGPITFGGCSFPQEIENCIKVLRPIIFGSCSSPQEIQNFIRVLRPKILKGYSTFQN